MKNVSDQQLAKEYQDGLSLRELSERHGVSHEGARRAVKRAGVPLRTAGRLVGVPRKTRRGPVTEAWLEARVEFDTNGGCWLWAGKRGPNGYAYGAIWCDGKRKTASLHRVAYSVFHGPIPDGMLVLHRCDVRSCLNPAHLFLGTQADNMTDMVTKGRNRNGQSGKL